MEHGVLLVSLDFELYWGVRDKRSIEEYGANIRGTWTAIPRILNLFETRGVRGTWATVGLVYCNNRKEALENAPALRPNYSTASLCPYKYLEENDDIDECLHFAPEMIDDIILSGEQELATHTYSHYYCLEDGQDRTTFKSDIESSIKVATGKGLTTASIVFPRNQWNSEYLPDLAKMGVLSYRGNEKSWLFKATESKGQGYLMRLGRLVDSYINISGQHTYCVSECGSVAPFNFPSSRFLRPFSQKLSFLDGLRLRRIGRAMKHAAQKNEIFHLWWHPHNFGTNLDRNLKFLEKVLDEFQDLERNYGMRAMTMSQLAAIAGEDAKRE